MSSDGRVPTMNFLAFIIIIIIIVITVHAFRVCWLHFIGLLTDAISVNPLPFC